MGTASTSYNGLAGASSQPLHGNPHYEKIKELSSGSFGFVQMARCLRTNAADGAADNIVAIKFIERSNASPRYVQSEILNHRLLRHPHVIEFKEVFLTQDHICIAMEFANGGDLFSYVKRAGRLNERASRCFFQQLILGLDYCHRMGVVNRDMKLENTLLHFLPNCRTPLLKICDFGYSKAHNLSAPKSKVGTLAYIAPEVITSQGRYDGRLADLWSCGVMLYICLFGKYPFEGGAAATTAAMDAAAAAARAAAVAARHAAAGTANIGRPAVASCTIKTQWSFPVDIAVSQDCRDLLLRLLVADPANRMVMGDILSHPWFLASLPSTALRMNDEFIAMKDYTGVQGEEEIKALLAVAAAPRRSHDTAAAAGYEDDENYDVIEDAIEDEFRGHKQHQ